MSRTVYYAASTLDGYIADPDDGIEWLTGYQGSFESDDVKPIESSYSSFIETVGALVSGSLTYEFCLGLETWPYPGQPYWVLTSRDLPKAEGEDIRIVDGDASELHAEMLESAGDKDLWVVGGGNVASQFADAGLLDIVHVTVVPLVLGEGKPLFDRGLSGGPMQLLSTTAYDSGMVGVVYEIRR